MYKKITLAFAFLLMIGSLSAQNIEVPQTQKPLIVKITASWCPLCGSWGWTFFDNIFEDNADDAAFLSVHHSGEHANATATALTENFQVFGQPRFLLDGVDQNVSSSNGNSKRDEIATGVANALAGSPSIQTGLDASFSSDQLTVEYAVELFEDLDGDYFVAFYLVEKLFVGYQASVGNDAEHRQMLRGELSGSTFGTALFSGSATAGDVFNGSMETSIDSYDPENLSIIAVIWKKDGSDYLVVNTNEDQEVQEKITSNTLESEQFANGVLVYPSVVKDDFTMELLFSDDSNQLKIALLDANGSYIKTIVNEAVTAGIYTFKANRPAHLPAGIYYLNIEAGQTLRTKRIIFE